MSDTTNFGPEHAGPEQDPFAPFPDAVLLEVFEAEGKRTGIYGPAGGSFDPVLVRLPSEATEIAMPAVVTSQDFTRNTSRLSNVLSEAQSQVDEEEHSLGRDIYEISSAIWQRLDRKQRKIAGVAMTAVALSLGIIGQVLPHAAETSEATSLDNVSPMQMPKVITVNYTVPDKPVRVYDLAVGLDMDSDEVANQLAPQLGAVPGEMDVLPAGKSVRLDAQGTAYAPKYGESIQSLSQRFGVAPNLLRAANDSLQDLAADQPVAVKATSIIIPKPVVLISAKTNVTPEQAVQLPGVAEATDSDTAVLAELDPGFDGGDTLAIPADAIPVEAITTTTGLLQVAETSTSAADTTTSAPETTTIAPETTTTTIPEVLAEPVSPEVARVNELLGAVNINASTIDLSDLVEAVKAADAAYAPNDPDRYPGLPAGYVKMALPNEIQGATRLRTVAERTMGAERYTTPQVEASMRAMSEAFEQFIYMKYPQFAGSLLRIRDANSPFHNSHNYGQMLDVSSQRDLTVTQYSTGPVFDSKFSPNYSEEFTVDMLLFAARLKVGDVRVVQKVVSSNRAVIKKVNEALGYAFMIFDDDMEHEDHDHFIFNKIFNLPASGLRAKNLLLSTEEDLWIGNRARAISPEKHTQIHGALETWVAEQIRKKTEATPAPAPAPETTAPAEKKPESLKVDSAVIDGLKLNETQKNFLKTIAPVVAEIAPRYNVNPQVLLAQASLESAYGTSVVATRAFNLFGVRMPAGAEGPSISIETKERANGVNVYRAYGSFAESIEDHARLITEKPWYADAAAHKDDAKLYLEGLVHELNPDGSIATRQGTKGVSSYSIDKQYVEKTLALIEQLKINQIIS